MNAIAFPFLCIFFTGCCCCPDNYNLYRNEACFRVIFSRRYVVLYSHAVQNCKDTLGQLASFGNKEQEEWVLNSTLRDAKNIQFSLWAGLQRNQTSLNSTTWYWLDGNPSAYRNWHAGEPHIVPGKVENCIQVFCKFNSQTKQTDHLGWNDLPCTYNHIHGYVCRAPYVPKVSNHTTTPQ